MKTDATLETERLIIRPWTQSEEDKTFFHRINSDPQMMEFFPFRLSRIEADGMLKRMILLGEEAGLTWALACDRQTGERFGFTGLWHVTFEEFFTPAVEIGWRYIPEVWGKGYATEAARELLRHGFEDVKLERIVSFAGEKNTASIAVMKKLGMSEHENSPFTLERVPNSHQHLKSHCLYGITAEAWKSRSTI